MAVEAIATQVGLSEPTLRKYYLRELERGPDLARGRVLEQMYSKAMAGNVTAQRAFLQLTETGLATVAAGKIDQRGAPEPRPERLGKKEERQQAAERIDGKFAPPPAPKLVVSR
jgi:hypothetical protein